MATVDTLQVEVPPENPIQNDVWIPNGVRTHFAKPGELVNLLEPLILALNWKGTYRQLIEALPHFADDLDLTDFINVFARLNYDNEQKKLSLKAVRASFMPCLFIPQDGHAMILLSRNGNNIQVIDGYSGETKEIIASNLVGTLYRFFQFDADKIVVAKQAESFSEIFYRFRPLVIQILVLTVLYNIFIAIVPLYIMMIYDKVIPSESISLAVSFLIGILIFLFSAQLLAVARIKIVAYIGARLDKTVGEAIIKHIMYLSPSYTENNTVGIQLARIKSFDSIRDFFTSNIALMACEFPFAIIFLGLIFVLGGWLGFVPVVLAVIFYIIYRITNPIIDRFIKLQMTQNTSKQAFLLETFLRLKDIKQTGRIAVWDEKFNNILVEMAQNNFNNALYNSSLNAISEDFMQFAALAMLAFGAVLAIDEVMTLGMVIAVMMLTWKVLNPLKSYFSSLPKIEQIMNTAGHINKLFAIPTEVTAERKAVVSSNEKAKIEFNRVTFRYRPEDAPAILGVSFVIQPGELICISGKNSAGKTTLLRLILGLYKIQAGNILINNMNIQQFDPAELRHTIAYMPQNVQLFYGTIKQNLLLGNITASEEEIIIAAKLAGVHDDIMRLPEQYNTKLGDEYSASFTPSFKQLIMLARAYLRKSSILLLDEPSSGFDAQTEQNFLEVIKYKRKESTILLVTHRPSLLKVADKILYMQGGEVALFGPAEKVLERLPQNLI